MRILFITEYYGETAPGLVAEKMVSGLSDYGTVNVVTSSVGNNTEKVVFSSIPKYTNYKLEKWSWILFGRNPLSDLWVKKVRTKIDVSKQYDLVFIIVSMWHMATLKLLNEIKKDIQCPVFAYFVDAIPAPEPYLTSEKIRKCFLNIVQKYSRHINIIYSTCSEMSMFQKTVTQNGNIQFKELLNPSDHCKMQDIGQPKSKTFIYTGKIYPPRTAGHLLKAFSKLVKYDPEVKLSFVGTDLSTEIESLDTNVASKISYHKYTHDLSEYFKDCCCFIDIGCDVPDDIFLSSKFPVYLAYNRPIISESSIGAPPRRLFNSMQSVYLCGHNENELFEAMKDVLCKSNTYGYTERYDTLNKFSVQYAALSVINDLKSFSSCATTAFQE